MAPSALGIGIPASSPAVPDHLREHVEKMLKNMSASMNASPFDWEMFSIDLNEDLTGLISKLGEKDWDVVMLGVGLRAGSQELVELFEKIINIVHQKLPKAKFAFNTTIEGAQEACQRALELPKV
ncbi:hypothetical protein EJ04DRAFT_549729 [Polyplosphaeria fusca]|uniref:Uncharacterized protein n=1 Tax=Polyplosphaeria fusca TaxID=682080 RepID=A0A9P4R8I1_9PLEO|nr:hypothetical protein EJ04DRAFT_549729 [Polyplosphaeria fusca]